LVAVAIPKIGDHGAETAGHEPKLATRARATPAGALAWVAYVRVVISFCAFTCCVSRWKNSEPRYPITRSGPGSTDLIPDSICRLVATG
jgi:hypothetical protein